MTARGYDNVSVLLAQYALIFVLNDRRTERGFFNIRKSQLFKSATHRFDACAIVVDNKRGRKTYDNGISAPDQLAYIFGAVGDLLGILRTDNKAFAAQNTFVFDNTRLIVGKTDRLYRTVTDALVTVFAIRFFKRQTVGQGIHFLSFATDFILYSGQNVLSKEFLCGFGGNGIEGILNHYAYAFLASAHTKGSAKLYFFIESVLRDQTLKLLDYLTRALDMT
jgi:hypothetical protein